MSPFLPGDRWQVWSHLHVNQEPVEIQALKSAIGSPYSLAIFQENRIKKSLAGSFGNQF